MAKIVFCLVLAAVMVVAAHARLIPNPDGDAGSRFQTSHQPGRLVRSESFGSTEVVQGGNYQTSLFDESSKGGEFGEFDRMQEDTTTSTMTNSFSDSFATETFPNSFPDSFAADTSFPTDSFSAESNYVNPAQGVSYNYAADIVNTKYDQGLVARRAGAGTTGAGEAASFTLEGNTEKTDSAEWTESEP